jgi:hypothetical protein
MAGMNQVKTSVGKDNGFAVVSKVSGDCRNIGYPDNLAGKWCHNSFFVPMDGLKIIVAKPGQHAYHIDWKQILQPDFHRLTISGTHVNS